MTLQGQGLQWTPALFEEPRVSLTFHAGLTISHPGRVDGQRRMPNRPAHPARPRRMAMVMPHRDYEFSTSLPGRIGSGCEQPPGVDQSSVKPVSSNREDGQQQRRRTWAAQARRCSAKGARRNCRLGRRLESSNQ